MTTSSSLEYGPVPDDTLFDLGRLLSDALHFNMSDVELRDWLERTGPYGFRAVWRGGKLASGLRFVRAGQWYGGRVVPAAAITTVGCAAEHRGYGASSFLMQHTHEELRDLGLPLAVLFPATLNFYRRSGYERAGAWNEYEAPAAAFPVGSRDLEIVSIGEGEAETVQALYDERARHTSGNLARWEALWRRATAPRDKPAQRFLIVEDGRPRGYVALVRGGQIEPIRLLDVCVLTRAVGERLFTFLADHRSLATTIIWHGGPSDPLLYLMPETQARTKETIDWVVRILDVELALRQRGYPAGLTASLHLEVRDDQLPWNAGRFVLQLTDGVADVRRGGDGSLKTDVRGLAAMYTGRLIPSELRLVGGIEADDASVTAAQLAFGGPSPWMPDIF